MKEFTTDRIELTTYPLVSVVIITYNEQEYLQKTIESLRLLDYPREKLEFILVDSQSTDDTVRIAKSFFDRILITEGDYHSPGKGQALGFSKARGEFTIVSSGDATMDPQWVRAGLKAFQDDPRKELVAVTGIIEELYPENKLSFIKSIYIISHHSRTIGDIPYATGGMYRMKHLRENGIQFETDIRMEEETAMGIELRQRGLVVKRIQHTFLEHESGYSDSWTDLWFQVRRHLRVAGARVWLWHKYKGESEKRRLLWKHIKDSAIRGFMIDGIFIGWIALLVMSPFIAFLSFFVAMLGVAFLGFHFSKKYPIPYTHAVGYVLYKFFVSYWLLVHAFVWYQLKTKVSTSYGYPHPVS